MLVGGLAGGIMTDWNSGTVTSNLWEWFCKLPVDERMQAVAIDDPLWIRLYLKLYKHDLKSRKKDRDVCFSIKRDRVNYMYGRLLKQANRAQSLGGSGGGGGGGNHHDGDDSDCPEVVDRGGEEAATATSLRTSGDIPNIIKDSTGSGGLVMEEEDDDEEIEEALAEEDDELSGALRIAYGEDDVSEEDVDVAARRAGQMLQRSLRLCSLGSPLDTLTLSSTVLDDPKLLHRLLRRVTKDDFLSKPLTAASAKQLSIPPSATASTLLTPASASSSIQVTLPETPWLQERDGFESVALRELLVNRLELSLWSAYWRRIYRCPSASRGLTLKAVSDQSKRLLAFSEKLDTGRQVALFDGLCLAQHLLQLKNGKARPNIAYQVVERLLFIPVHWVYKDEGLAVRRVLDRVQTACADCVANELLADEGNQATGSMDNSGSGKNKAKKAKKKKKKQQLKQQQQAQQHKEGEEEEEEEDDDDKEVKEEDGGAVANSPKADLQGPLEGKEEEPVQTMKKIDAETSAAGTRSRAETISPTSTQEEDDDDQESWEQVGPKGSKRAQRSRSHSNHSLQGAGLSPTATSADHPQKGSSGGSNRNGGGSGRKLERKEDRRPGRADEGPWRRVSSFSPSTEEKKQPDGHAPGAVAGEVNRLRRPSWGRWGTLTQEEEERAQKEKDAATSPASSSGIALASGHADAPAQKPKDVKEVGVSPLTRPIESSSTAPCVVPSESPVLDPAIHSSPSSLSSSEGKRTSLSETISSSLSSSSSSSTQSSVTIESTVASTVDGLVTSSDEVKRKSTARTEAKRRKKGRDAVKNVLVDVMAMVDAAIDHIEGIHHQEGEAAGQPLHGSSSSSLEIEISSVAVAGHRQISTESVDANTSSGEDNPSRATPSQPPSPPTSIHHSNQYHSNHQHQYNNHNKNRISPPRRRGHHHSRSNGYGGYMGDGSHGYHSERKGGHHRSHSHADRSRRKDYASRQAEGHVGHMGMDDYPSPEEQERVEKFAKDIQTMREVLTKNVEAFMNKREVEMKHHRAQRQLVVDEMTSIVHGLWAQAKVELYGSCFTGLDLASSDVDIVVCGLPTNEGTPQAATGKAEDDFRSSTPEATKKDSDSSDSTDEGNSPRSPSLSSSSTASSPRLESNLAPVSPSTRVSPKLSPTQHSLPNGHGESVRYLHQLAAALEGKPWIRSMKTIDTAFVPVIKLVADPSVLGGAGGGVLVPIDISLEGPQHGGIASSLLIRDMIKPGGPYAHAVPLTLVLKTVMSQRGLNQPWCGGLSSYALMLMVIALLQQFETPEVAQANVMAMAHSVEAIKRKMSGAPLDYGNALRNGKTKVPSPPPLPLQQAMIADLGRPSSPTELSYKIWTQFSATASQEKEDESATGGEMGVAAVDTSSVMTPPPCNYPGMPVLSQGFLLTYFLEYFGRVFNPRAEGIAVDQGYGLTFSLADYLLATGVPASDPITILDPLDRSVNVSRCCFRIGEIQWIFGQCLLLLELKGTEMAQKITEDKELLVAKENGHVLPPTANGGQTTTKGKPQQQTSTTQQQKEAAAAGTTEKTEGGEEVTNILGLVLSY